MILTTLPSFELSGLHIHTTREHQQAKTDIAQLWKRFYREDVSDQVDYGIDGTVYLLFTDYSDDRQTFSVWLGLQTDADAPLPMGLRRLRVPEATYYGFDSASDLPADMQTVWNTVDENEANLARRFAFDFECYPDGDNGRLFISTAHQP